MMVLSRKSLLLLAVSLLFLCALLAVPKTLAVDGVADNVRIVPIVMYHMVLDDEARSGKYVVTPKALEDDFRFILDSGYQPVFLSELTDFSLSRGELPEKPIVICFDDGYYNNYLYAFPLIKQYKLKCELSVIVRHSEDASEDASEGASEGGAQNPAYSHCTWAQLREMRESGLVRIANHTYDLHTNTSRNGVLRVSGESEQSYRKKITDDILKAQQLLLENVGIEPLVFTYPFGSYSAASEEILDELDFVVSLSCEEGLNHIAHGGSLRLLRRFNRASGESAEVFFSDILD